MAVFKKCIGIVSYLPEEGNNRARTRRSERLTNLLLQITDLWPTIDIMIITQNWKDFTLPELSNKVIRFDYEQPLTIVGAREALRNKVIELAYDYVILIDDDAHINCESKEIAQAYLDELDKHPDGFCFIHSEKHWHTCDDYIQAPLNLCALSKYICQQEAVPAFYLEKNEALEDDIYAVLLHIKYADHEFLPPTGIQCDHFKVFNYFIDTKDNWPSTWNNNNTQFQIIVTNTQSIINYIVNHKDLDVEDAKKTLNQFAAFWNWRK